MTFEQNKAKYINKFILGIGQANKGLIFFVIDIAYSSYGIYGTSSSIYIDGIDCETLKLFDNWHTGFAVLDEQFEIIG